MPRRPDAVITPNTALLTCRRSTPSPRRAGQALSRGEFADAVNEALHALYPAATASALAVDARWVGKLERGEHRWPCAERRAALRRATGVVTDAAIGLYSPRLPAGGTVRADRERPRELDVTAPHPARRYGYWLGGKDHFPADRRSAAAIERVFPSIVTAVRENRAFVRRAVRYLDRRGVRQFVDVGAGLPTRENTHDMVSGGRVLYVDNDPIVIAHARALLDDGPRGRTACLEADLRDPGAILGHPMVDLRKPVGLLMAAVLHFVTDDEAAGTAVKGLVGALPSGSFLVVSHATLDFTDPGRAAAVPALAPDLRPRPRAKVAEFLDGLDVVEPGLVAVCDWRRPGPYGPTPAEVAIYGAVGRLP